MNYHFFLITLITGFAQARRGYSRDSRPDCVQVLIGVVVSREGLPLAFEVFDGNRSDVTTVEEIGSGRQARLKIEISKNEERYAWALNTSGSYLLRTNWKEGTPTQLWNTYIQLTQAEDAFRITKSDLGVRPIYHQKSGRVQAHILVCFLALAMWHTLQQWMSASGLGTAPRKLLEEMKEIRSMDVLLPTQEKTLHLWVVSTAPKALKILLHRLKLPMPNRSKMIQNVVQTFAP